jgi:hypothetical protein
VSRPIFNMILALDNDFAAVRSVFTDHLFCGSGYSGRKRGRVGFVPLDGLGGAIDHSRSWASTAASPRTNAARPWDGVKEGEGDQIYKRPPHLRDGLFFTNQAAWGVGGWGWPLS